MSVYDLGAAFTLGEARVSGMRKDHVYEMLAQGEIERLGRGVYLFPGVVDPFWEPLVAATAVSPDATLCLSSALVHHGLSDMIPFGTDIALPRGKRHPAGFAHVSWHSFDTVTFDIGREPLEVAAGIFVAIYSAERTIVDVFRMMHHEGTDVAHEGLRTWLRRRGSSAGKLLGVASSFPQAKPRILQALEALL